MKSVEIFVSEFFKTQFEDITRNFFVFGAKKLHESSGYINIWKLIVSSMKDFLETLEIKKM